MSSDSSSTADRPGVVFTTGPESAAANPPAAIRAPTPPPVRSYVHPLDRTKDNPPHIAAAEATVQPAWQSFVWLLSFLGVLLAISYLVPYIAEQTQYAITRGKQRAEHEFAQAHLGESPLGGDVAGLSDGVAASSDRASCTSTRRAR